MEKIVTLISNIVLFLFLIGNVNDYADAVLIVSAIILMCLFIFYLVRYKGRYISKNTILIYALCVILQGILILILERFNIWQTSSGFMGLGIFIYFSFLLLLFILLLIINMIKYIVKVLRKDGT